MAKNYRVEIVNVMITGQHCGAGQGKTLAEAQADAMRIAKSRYEDATLSPSGYQVYVSSGTRC
jgi:hypothetical protein